MKFTLVKDLRQDSIMRPSLAGLLLGILLYIVSDIFVKDANFGVFTEDILKTLFGDEEQYIDPISQASFLELWHMEIFFLMMILLTLSAVYARLTQNTKLDQFVLIGTFGSALGSLIALVLSYYFDPIFVSIYSYAFLLWHLLALYMVIISLWKLYSA